MENYTRAPKEKTADEGHVAENEVCNYLIELHIEIYIACDSDLSGTHVN